MGRENQHRTLIDGVKHICVAGASSILTGGILSLRNPVREYPTISRVKTYSSKRVHIRSSQVSPNLCRRASDLCQNAALNAEDDDSDESEVEEKCLKVQRIGYSNCSSSDELRSVDPIIVH